MFILTDKSSVTICRSESISWNEEGNPVVTWQGSVYAVSKLMIGAIYDNVTELPEHYVDGAFTFDGTNWARNPAFSIPDFRKHLYETEKNIEWKGELMTVDGANKIWADYAPEGESKAEVRAQLSALITAAKNKIREDFPDE